jgi:hypothetical protein
VIISGEKGHAHCILTDLRESKILDRSPEERIGNLAHETGSITGERVTADRSPMLKVLENLNSFLNDRMTGFAVKMCDESYSATLVLMRGIVQSVGFQPSRGIAVSRNFLF